MGEERDRLLSGIVAGDVILAMADDGLPKILLVYKTTKAKIFTRLITSQTRIELGRDGKSTFVDNNYTCEIVSVRPLPPDACGVALGLDRKMRLGQSPDGSMLTRAEKQFLLKAVDYFLARPLADADPLRLPGEGAAPAEFDLSPDCRE
jgi:hypothetical protein